MIYKFKVLSEEDDKFFMDIEIESDQTFYDLHECIQDELEYDSSHLATFFIANHNWQRKQEVPLMVDEKSDKAVVTMENAVLSNFIKDAHQKLIYLFDFINDRSYFIELIETKPETNSRYYPICTDFGGEILPQFGKKSVKKFKIFEDDDDIDVFSSKKSIVPSLDDFDDDLGAESLDKEISFDLDDDMLGEEEEEVDNDKPEFDDDEDDDDEPIVDDDDDDDDKK